MMNRAELSDNRMVTDNGPQCPDCFRISGIMGPGMWVYLTPTEGDWEIAKVRDGHAVVQAQCACCHRLECFDVSPADVESVVKVREAQARAHDLAKAHPDHAHVFSVVPGR